MQNLLFKSINDKVAITEKDFETVLSFFASKKLRKKQYLLQEGNVCKYTAFVTKGALRSYTIDEKGNEHIIQFATEGWWISDNYSFFTNQPASYTIDAIEDTELLLITLPSMEEMLMKLPIMERYFRLLFQNNIIAIQSRLVCSLSQSAEEKYNKINEDYPAIIQRVPQHMIASFLGITPETLSRIRKQRSEKD